MTIEAYVFEAIRTPRGKGNRQARYTGSGREAFVRRADELAMGYGPRFQVPDILRRPPN
jgi:hypothetical protein